MAAEIVHYHDVSWSEAWHQDLLDVTEEAFAVDRAIEDARRCHPVNPQGCEEGERLPVAMRNPDLEPLAAPAPAAQWRHVGLHPCFIDEHQPRDLDPLLDPVPPAALAGNVRPCGLFGVKAFF